jgi:amino acid transporter
MNGHTIRTGERGLVAWAAALVAVLAMAPISLFAASAAGRLLQPLPNQPAAAEERIFEWFVALPAMSVSVLLVALPLLGMVLAGAVLWRSWRSDADLRADVRLAAGLLGRLIRKPLVWLSAAVLLVGTLLVIAAVVHGIAG